MGFMQHQIIKDEWWEIDGTHGTTFLPTDVTGSLSSLSYDETVEALADYYEGKIEQVTKRTGYGARLSAPGYMDCTEWSVFDTEQEAQDYLRETFDDDEDEESEEA